MARSLTAFLKRENVPECGQLQKVIDTFGISLKLDDAYAPFAFAGFLPCTLDGEDAGFELRFGEVDDAAPDGRDATLSLKWTGDPREEAAARVVGAALARGFDAIVRSDGGVTPLTADELLEAARVCLD